MNFQTLKFGNKLERGVPLANIRNYSQMLANVRKLFYFRRLSQSFAIVSNLSPS